jgi:hypothetical protein
MRSKTKWLKIRLRFFFVFFCENVDFLGENVDFKGSMHCVQSITKLTWLRKTCFSHHKWTWICM